MSNLIQPGCPLEFVVSGASKLNVPLTGTLLATDASGGTVIGTLTATTAIFGLDTPSEVSGDSAIVINRAAVGNPWSHGIADQSHYGFATGAYNSFDAIARMTVSGDHIAGFQSRNRFAGTTLNNWYGFISIPSVLSGTVAELDNFAARDVTLAGGGAVTTQYGLRIPALTSASLNVSIASNGTATQGWHAGGFCFGVGTFPAASALVDLVSTTRGLGLPSMTTTQRDDIASPAERLLIYNSTTHKLNVRVAAAWEEVTSA